MVSDALVELSESLVFQVQRIPSYFLSESTLMKIKSPGIRAGLKSLVKNAFKPNNLVRLNKLIKFLSFICVNFPTRPILHDNYHIIRLHIPNTRAKQLVVVVKFCHGLVYLVINWRSFLQLVDEHLHAFEYLERNGL